MYCTILYCLRVHYLAIVSSSARLARLASRRHPGFAVSNAFIASASASSGNFFTNPGCAAFHASDTAANRFFSSSVVRTPPLVCSFALMKLMNPVTIACDDHAGFQLS